MHVVANPAEGEAVKQAKVVSAFAAQF